MFVYEFKNLDKCLITKITISGSHLTLYTSKPNSQELNSLIKTFNLTSMVSGDHPSHVFCHSPYITFSSQGDAIPHKHLKFPLNVERVSYLKNIFDFLIEYQKYIEKIINDKISSTENCQLLKFGTFGVVLSISCFLLTEDSISKAVYLGLATQPWQQ